MTRSGWRRSSFSASRTINFDRTGTTHIGKYILNHSFMMPGLIGVGVATVVAMLIAQVVV